MNSSALLIGLSAAGLFLITSLILHVRLEAVDDEDRRQFASFVSEEEPSTGIPGIPMRPVFEAEHGTDLRRTRSFVEGLLQPDPETQYGFDRYHCPDEPAEGYPIAWRLYDVLDNWSVDDTDVPPTIYQGLCVFDWDTDERKVETYRQAEKPFILRNHPDVQETTERWSQPGYLEQIFGPVPQSIEHSKTNHLMYWSPASRDGRVPPGWEPPTDHVDMAFGEWLAKAKELEASDQNQAEQEHWYYRLNANIGVNEQIYDELPWFKPVESLFMVEPEQHRGINCRAGMKGNMAESHFDMSRNWITLLTGQRRYILAHPDQCENLEMYPKEHPSLRHTSVDWSHLPNRDPIASAQVNEVVLQPADAMYLPTSWFHHIISLTTNVQCNARSGVTDENADVIQQCMGMTYTATKR